MIVSLFMPVIFGIFLHSIESILKKINSAEMRGNIEVEISIEFLRSNDGIMDIIAGYIYIVARESEIFEDNEAKSISCLQIHFLPSLLTCSLLPYRNGFK